MEQEQNQRIEKEVFWQTSREIDKVSESLSKAQGMIEEITKDSTATVTTKSGGSYSYSFLSLPALTNLIRKPMSENGLSLIFSTSKLNGTPVTIGYLSHSSGQWMMVSCPIFLDQQQMQALGSAKTYSRRYIIQDLFNIAADDDDDGNIAQGNDATYSNQAQRAPSLKPQNFAPQTADAAKKGWNK